MLGCCYEFLLSVLISALATAGSFEVGVARAGDAPAAHLGVAMDVRVGEPPAAREEDSHAQQQHRSQQQQHREQ